MSEQSVQESIRREALRLKELLLEAKSVIIGGEASPDPDCAGSQWALRRLILKLNPALDITLLNDQGCPDKLRFFKDARLLQVPKDHPPAEIAIVVDGGIERCGPKTRAIVDRCKKHVLVDHHLVGSTRSYEVSLVNVASASTTELIYDIAQAWGTEIDADIADLLYLGLVADTGSFQFSSTTAHTLRVAAELVAAGARSSVIAEKIRLERPFDFLKFQSRVFAKLERYHDGRVLVCIADKEDLAGLKLGDAPFDEALSSFSFIKGVEVTVMLKGGSSFGAPGQEPWRLLSFRSRGKINVADLARSLDPQGGGHSCAAGCRMKGNDGHITGQILDKLALLFKAS